MADQYQITARQTGPLTFVADNGAAEVSVGAGKYQPTELFLASLGTCMLSTMLEYAQRNGIPLKDISVDMSGQMANGPRRISQVNVVYHLPAELSQVHTDALVRAGNHCTIHQSLAHPPELAVSVDRTAQTGPDLHESDPPSGMLHLQPSS